MQICSSFRYSALIGLTTNKAWLGVYWQALVVVKPMPMTIASWGELREKNIIDLLAICYKKTSVWCQYEGSEKYTSLKMQRFILVQGWLLHATLVGIKAITQVLERRKLFNIRCNSVDVIWNRPQLLQTQLFVDTLIGTCNDCSKCSSGKRHWPMLHYCRTPNP